MKRWVIERKNNPHVYVEAEYYATGSEGSSGLIEFKDDKHKVLLAIPSDTVELIREREPEPITAESGPRVMGMMFSPKVGRIVQDDGSVWTVGSAYRTRSGGYNARFEQSPYGPWITVNWDPGTLDADASEVSEVKIDGGTLSSLPKPNPDGTTTVPRGYWRAGGEGNPVVWSDGTESLSWLYQFSGVKAERVYVGAYPTKLEREERSIPE